MKEVYVIEYKSLFDNEWHLLEDKLTTAEQQATGKTAYSLAKIQLKNVEKGRKGHYRLRKAVLLFIDSKELGRKKRKKKGVKTSGKNRKLGSVRESRRQKRQLHNGRSVRAPKP